MAMLRTRRGASYPSPELRFPDGRHSVVDVFSITDEWVKDLEGLSFSVPVSHVYNPLIYARRPYLRYMERYGIPPKDALLVGMNPGPFGMVQTGVPFGDVVMVRDWLGICEPVGKPRREHPKRPVQGFACPRREISGSRLWGWARDQFEEPEGFFRHFLVVNYCPLCFLEETGRNRTPDKLPVYERARLFEVCDRALALLVDYYRPRFVIGIGGFAETRIRAALSGSGAHIGRIPHPSPASPSANRGWAEAATRALIRLGMVS